MGHPNSICGSCHAGCCRAYAVPITGADVLRLERQTGLGFWDFACRWEDRLGHIAGDYVPHLHFDDEPLTPFTLCLLHRPSELFPTTTRCRFLEESPPTDAAPLGTGRCGVYDQRPAACRVFPLNLQKSSLLTVLEDVPDHGRPNDGSDPYRLCPRPWEPSDVDPIEAPQQLVVADFEADFFRLVAAVWNQNPGPWLLFPDFLRLVYRRRVVKATAQGLDAEIPDSVTLPFTRDDRQQAA